MAKLIIPVGLPSSGKTTYSMFVDASTVSADAVRFGLFGDEKIRHTDEAVKAAMNILGTSAEYEDADSAIKNMSKEYKICLCDLLVYRLMDIKCEALLRNGCDVYYDALALTRSERADLLETFKGLYTDAEAVFFDVPPDECVRRIRRSASGEVSESTVWAMSKRLQPPEVSEGFDLVTVMTE